MNTTCCVTWTRCYANTAYSVSRGRAAALILSTPFCSRDNPKLEGKQGCCPLVPLEHLLLSCTTYSVLHTTHLSCQGAHILWYWGRDEHGMAGTDAPRSYPESVLTQPITMDAFHRTMVQVNWHSEAVVELASTPRHIWVLYSLESHHASSSFPIGAYMR